MPLVILVPSPPVQVIGDMVNLAARLMGTARSDEVLVDEATKDATEAYIAYEVNEKDGRGGGVEERAEGDVCDE